MKRVIYCSQACYDLPGDELVALLQACRRRNEAAGLTGMLLYAGQSFLQLLEGEAAAVDATYERIVVDDRHTRIRPLFHGEVALALFPDWTMGFEHVDDEALAQELPGFTPATEYPLVNPDLIINAGVATTLLTLYSKNRAQ